MSPSTSASPSRSTLLRRAALALGGAALALGLNPLQAHATTLKWVPPQTIRWQYQLQPNSTGAGSAGGISVGLCQTPYTGGSCVTPQVYDIDLYGPDGKTVNTPAVSAIHAAGAHAVCYVDAGTWENWRPDASSFPTSDKGKNVSGWAGEKWLDIRDTTHLLPIIQARVAKCRSGGYDAVEFDNVDGYQNPTGFPLTSAQQLTFNKGLAKIAHDDGLAAGLKNDLGQVTSLVSSFDFAINEECQYNSECASLDPFLSAGKAVLQVEYTDDGASAGDFCPPADEAGRNAILKQLDLHATPWTPCE
jgi:hypothetical protein